MLSYNEVWATLNRWRIETRVTRLRNLALLVYGVICRHKGRDRNKGALALAFEVLSYLNGHHEWRVTSL